MNKKEIKAQVGTLLEAGTPKSEVFSRLSGQGVKDRQLAYFIAAHPLPWRCDAHERKVNVLVSIMLLQAMFGFFAGFVIGSAIGPLARWILAGVVALFPVLFARGFYKHKVGAYNAYLLLSIVFLPKSLAGFGEHPVANGIALAINLSTIAFVWYVRSKLFPDFVAFSPAKVKGQYRFEN